MSWMMLTLLLLLLSAPLGFTSTWSDWWTYEGISGPDFWGLVNPDWTLCSRGMLQSPINIDPKHLLYDPHLQPLRIDRQRVSGTILNTGHDLKINIDDISGLNNINMSGGPFSYQYRVIEISLHFGRTDSYGSEHSINGVHFPAEIQILGYNTDLYGNLTHAIHGTHGLCVLSVLVQIGPSAINRELEAIAQHLKYIRYKGLQVELNHGIAVHGLLPHTDDYITYEGSLTEPGCQETVTWIILNKPIYTNTEHLTLLRELMQGDQNSPKIPMANNFRSLQQLNQRPVRTNINFQNSSAGCTTENPIYYKANVLVNERRKVL